MVQKIAVPLHRQKETKEFLKDNELSKKVGWLRKLTELKRKGKKMKKMIMTLVAMLSMTTAFAEDENTNAVKNVEAYKMDVNMDKLSDALHLDWNQRNAVENIHHVFNTEINYAAQYGKNDRDAMVKRAIDTDVKRMRSVLTNEQMRTYLLLLNTTLNNRGLNK